MDTMTQLATESPTHVQSQTKQFALTDRTSNPRVVFSEAPPANLVLTGTAVFGKYITMENAMKLNQNGLRPKKLIVALIATLLVTAALSAPARAGDNKVYAGSTCKPMSSGTNGLFYGNNATNLGTANIHVICPVVREITTGGTPKAYVHVNDPDVDCTFVVSNATGLGTFDEGTANPVSLASGVYRFDIQGVSQVSQGAYHIRCTLPPSTAVLHYSVTE
jgi:hypothetical protein